jgi:hypothetical protein
MITNKLGGFNSQIGRWLSCYFAPCAGSWAAPGSHQRFEWRFIMMVCGTAAINQWPGLQSWPAQRTILGPGALPTANALRALNVQALLPQPTAAAPQQAAPPPPRNPPQWLRRNSSNNNSSQACFWQRLRLSCHSLRVCHLASVNRLITPQHLKLPGNSVQNSRGCLGSRFAWCRIFEYNAPRLKAPRPGSKTLEDHRATVRGYGALLSAAEIHTCEE